MKTAVVYYTFGGSTKREAERLAGELGADICRVSEVKNRNLLTSFIPGSFQAMKQKATPIRPLSLDLLAYERLIIGCPLWANYPAPAFNSIVKLLPPGKEVEVFICSGSGDSSKSEPKTKELISRQGCRVVSYRDVKTNTPPGKIKE
ncbi:MAG: flavodoxin family protein [Clostridia bacterium]|nr:flavodoxin family protein [Clostridia bacterium]